MKPKVLISIVGPTAIGKTALSIQLAQHFKTEILSADSRQFYKEMSIGTAVPEPSELAAAKHHFIQHLSIQESYSVGQFENDAISLLNSLFNKLLTVIMVGGSGLYTQAVIKGLDAFPKIDPDIRSSLNKTLKEKGLLELQNQLKTVDFESFQTIAISNPQRLIRALEVSLGTGQPYSSYKTNSSKLRPFKTINIGLTTEREQIYTRINQRVDHMIEGGLIEEAKSLYPFRDRNALNTVGYKEVFNYLDQLWGLDFAISEIKKNTRRFAKRQLTWYSKDHSIQWFDINDPLNQIIHYIEQQLKTFENQ